MHAAFARAMQALGPFAACPSLAVAVSGGADSMALAVLARDWVRRHQGSVTALIVDHGLRAESADEARLTACRLRHLGIDSRILGLIGLERGAALAERARIMRYHALTEACRAMGCLNLLVGHHGGDQAETLAMRVLRGSRTDGLAGMAALRETPTLRLLRPMLGFDPAALRHFLTDQRVAWVEDPTNQDRRTLRARMRQGLAAHVPGLLNPAIGSAGRHRARDEAAMAEALANRVVLRPEGFAVIAPGRITAPALSSLIQAIGGGRYPPDPDRIAELACRVRSATLAGARIMPAGRLGDGWLVIREEAAMQGEVRAGADTAWDNRFRVIVRGALPDGATISALGSQASGFRHMSDLPSGILRTLPALRIGKKLAAVPHLRYVACNYEFTITAVFSPLRPLSGPAFVPADLSGSSAPTAFGARPGL